MSVRSIIREQLDECAAGMPASFDVHAHTGADIDGAGNRLEVPA